MWGKCGDNAEDQRDAQTLYDNAYKLTPYDEMRKKCGKLEKTRIFSQGQKRGGFIFQSLRESWSIGDSKS